LKALRKNSFSYIIFLFLFYFQAPQEKKVKKYLFGFSYEDSYINHAIKLKNHGFFLFKIKGKIIN